MIYQIEWRLQFRYAKILYHEVMIRVPMEWNFKFKFRFFFSSAFSIVNIHPTKLSYIYVGFTFFALLKPITRHPSGQPIFFTQSVIWSIVCLCKELNQKRLGAFWPKRNCICLFFSLRQKILFLKFLGPFQLWNFLEEIIKIWTLDCL